MSEGKRFTFGNMAPSGPIITLPSVPTLTLSDDSIMALPSVADAPTGSRERVPSSEPLPILVTLPSPYEVTPWTSLSQDYPRAPDEAFNDYLLKLLIIAKISPPNTEITDKNDIILVANMIRNYVKYNVGYAPDLKLTKLAVNIITAINEGNLQDPLPLDILPQSSFEFTRPRMANTASDLMISLPEKQIAPEKNFFPLPEIIAALPMESVPSTTSSVEPVGQGELPATATGEAGEIAPAPTPITEQVPVAIIESVPQTVEPVQILKPPAPVTTTQQTLKPFAPFQHLKPLAPITTSQQTLKPIAPVQTLKPAGLTSPTQTLKPIAPVSTVQTLKPVGSPTQTLKPIAPVSTVQTLKPVGTISPTQTLKPIAPVSTVQTLKPVGTISPTQTLKPIAPVSTVQTLRPAGLGSPTQVLKPAGLTSPSQPATISLTAKPPATGPVSQTLKPIATFTPSTLQTLKPAAPLPGAAAPLGAKPVAPLQTIKPAAAYAAPLQLSTSTIAKPMAAPLQLSTSTLAKPMAAPLSLGSTVQPGLLSPKSLIAKPTALPGTFATSAKPMAAPLQLPSGYIAPTFASNKPAAVLGQPIAPTFATGPTALGQPIAPTFATGGVGRKKKELPAFFPPTTKPLTLAAIALPAHLEKRAELGKMESLPEAEYDETAKAALSEEEEEEEFPEEEEEEEDEDEEEEEEEF